MVQFWYTFLGAHLRLIKAAVTEVINTGLKYGRFPAKPLRCFWHRCNVEDKEKNMSCTLCWEPLGQSNVKEAMSEKETGPGPNHSEGLDNPTDNDGGDEDEDP